MAHVNKRRLVFSIAVASALIAPVITKSYKKSHIGYWTIEYEDDESRYLEAHEESIFSCAVLWYDDSLEREALKKICDNGAKLRGNNIIKKNHFVPPAITSLIQDTLIGFMLPWITVYTISPFLLFILKKYINWIFDER